MKEKASWGLFKLGASARIPLPTSENASFGPVGGAGVAVADEMRPGTAQAGRSLDSAYDDFPEPVLVLDGEGHLLVANAAARDLARRLGARLDAGSGVEPFLAKVRVVNGGGSPPWLPVPGAGGFDAAVAGQGAAPAEGIFEVRTVASRGADGRPAGWLVRLIEISPLISALRGQAAATRHRDQMLKLLSHDMRSPMAAILATLNHSALGAMPANLKQIIESAARRALHMVDSTVRLIRAESADYTFVEIDFCHIFEEVIDASWSLSKEVGVKMVVAPASVELPILADRGSLTEALTDLVRKLLTESIAGGVLMCAFAIDASQDQRTVTLTIEDAGGGGAARGGAGPSRGLAVLSDIETAAADDSAGLDFFKTIVARHSGSTMCENEPGAGRSVSITIPLADPVVAGS